MSLKYPLLMPRHSNQNLPHLSQAYHLGQQLYGVPNVLVSELVAPFDWAIGRCGSLFRTLKALMRGIKAPLQERVRQVLFASIGQFLTDQFESIPFEGVLFRASDEVLELVRVAARQPTVCHVSANPLYGHVFLPTVRVHVAGQ